LWWGHRIPAWHCSACGQITVARQDPDRCAHCQSAEIEQDPDVLDTWFSSGLWPFSTLGWPEETDDLRTFYPTTILETGYDILFFWVARMVMMGLEFTGRLPFETVYLHGLIRDEQGRKMSKTLANVIDPLEVMNEFGADALRLTLLTGSSPGNDMNLSVPRVQANRNFANKVWNAGRLVISAVKRAPAAGDPSAAPTLADRWILARRAQLLRNVERLFEGFQYGEAGRQIYEFFWGEFADWYLEAAKLQATDGPGRARRTAEILVTVLDSSLRLLHPYTPFVTEELWGRLRDACLAHPAGLAPPGGWGEALIVASWPEAGTEAGDEESVRRFELLREVIRTIRNARAEKQIDPGARIGAVVGAGPETSWLQEQVPLLAAFARLDPDRMVLQERLEAPPAGSLPLTAGGIEIYLMQAGDVDVRAEGERVARQLAAVEAQIERLQSLLAGPFASRAPAEVVAAERQKLEQAREEAARLKAQLHGLSEG
jgi:valyl-tRNA synthetase